MGNIHRQEMKPGDIIIWHGVTYVVGQQPMRFVLDGSKLVRVRQKPSKPNPAYRKPKKKRKKK
jgi:hypothetical protein